MEIVEMEPRDAAELAELDKMCFAVPWSEKLFQEEAKSAHARYFVAKADEKIVGYGGIWLVMGEGQITNIAVLPEFRRRGIAERILERLIRTAKDAEQIVLEVRKSNDGAIALYEKSGFKKVGIRKRFYRDPIEDAIIMIRGEI